MVLRPKPPQAIEAQVAVYAESFRGNTEPERELVLLRQLGNVATYHKAPNHVSYPHSHPLKSFSPQGSAHVVKPEGYPEALFVNQEYVEVLRQPGRRQQIHNVTKMLAAYDSFTDKINELQIVGLPLAQAKQHDHFLGSGGSEMAFLFAQSQQSGTSKLYVARCEQDPTSLHGQAKVNARAAALALGMGIPYLEQGVAISYNPAIVITEFMLGQHLPNLVGRQPFAFPSQHLQDLKNTFQAASERAIDIDGNIDNFLYDASSGFNIIDYRAGNPAEPSPSYEHNRRAYENLLHSLGSNAE